MLIKNTFLLILFLLLANCAQLSGQISSGIYTNSTNEFSVNTPPIPGLSAQDGHVTNRTFVDFYQARGFWQKYGLYSVEWYRQKTPFKSTVAYYSSTKRFVVDYVKNNYSHRGVFKLEDTRKTTINNLAAYQFISVGVMDEHAAIWLATSINFGNRIAIVSMVIPSENIDFSAASSQGLNQLIPWKKYNLFVNSLKKHH